MFLKNAEADLFVTAFGPRARSFVAHGGWVGSGELWLPVFERLSEHWRTVTYDHRGTGATITRGAITFDALVEDLFRVLDALGVEQCILGGESSGALVVLEAALRQPQRFTGLVLVDGRSESGNTAGAARFIHGCKTDFAATMDAFVRACVTEHGAEAELEWARKIVLRSDGPAAVALMESMWSARVADRLEQITQPTLLIHGRRDLITPVSASEEMARRIPDAKLVVIEDAGHVPVMTRPAEVSAAIREFFPE